MIDLDEVDVVFWDINKKEYFYRFVVYYGVFRDLFGGVFFYFQVDLEVSYDILEEDEVLVFYGNLIEFF